MDFIDHPATKVTILVLTLLASGLSIWAFARTAKPAPREYADSSVAQVWQVGIGLSIVFLSIAAGAAAMLNWGSELKKRQIGDTLQYISPLQTRDFIDSLWDLQLYTSCFESKEGYWLSYRDYKDIKADPKSDAMVRGWWKAIEYDDVPSDCLPKELGARRGFERKLFYVYGRLEALASCTQSRITEFGPQAWVAKWLGAGNTVCDLDRVVPVLLEPSLETGRSGIGMVEAFDYLTVLAISNYLLHATERSREWEASGHLITLVERLELYAKPFLSRPGRLDLVHKGRSGNLLNPFPDGK